MSISISWIGKKQTGEAAVSRAFNHDPYFFALRKLRRLPQRYRCIYQLKLVLGLIYLVRIT